MSFSRVLTLWIRGGRCHMTKHAIEQPRSDSLEGTMPCQHILFTMSRIAMPIER